MQLKGATDKHITRDHNITQFNQCVIVLFPHNMSSVPRSNVNRTCMHEKCAKRASFGIPGDSKASFCKQHKAVAMKSFDTRSCAEAGCKKRPNFSMPHERLATHCYDHKTTNMISRDKRICKKDGCPHRARFAMPGEKPWFCLIHMTQDMVNVTQQVCQYPGCHKYPCYGYPSKDLHCKKTTHCVHHHCVGMVNVKRKTCTAPLCTAYAYSPRQSKGLCSRCFAYTYPEARQSRRTKTKESLTFQYLQERFPSAKMSRDQIITGGCSKYRPDILCDMVTHVVIIEIDENQHESYEPQCENKRLVSLWQDLAHRPIVVIRFNPDSYKVSEDTKKGSCFRYNAATGMPFVPAKMQSEWESRLDTLGNAVSSGIAKIPDKSISVTHLFYDGYLPIN